MRRNRKLGIFALTAILAFSTGAIAQDRDGDRDDYRHSPAQAKDSGYQQGYHDGYKKGRDEGRKNGPYDYRTPDWREATHGYKSGMGPLPWFQSGYQQGYREGFESGYASVRPAFRGSDPDDFHYQRNGYSGSVGYQIGYQDGATVAREDLAKNKRFDPNPRGPYEDRDHGYLREYGDKNYYQQQYSDGYRAGYQAVFDR
jgi:flagellar biosynthesis/type III secretory pathway protein FliH